MSMFKKAQETSTVKTAKGKGKADVVAIDGLEELAAINAVIKALEGMKTSADEKVKSQMQDYFVKTGTAQKAKPANFKGEEGKASGSLQLRKRTSRATLTDEEVAKLEKNGIDYDVTEDVVGTFIINPDYAEDEALLERVSTALEGVEGIPEDFIQQQVGVSRRTVSDLGLAQIFTKNAKVCNELFPIVATLATRLKVGGGDVMESMEVLMELMGADQADAE